MAAGVLHMQLTVYKYFSVFNNWTQEIMFEDS